MEELGRRFSWASLPLVATIAPLLCPELTLQVEDLREEVEVLRSKVPGRARFGAETVQRPCALACPAPPTERLLA